MHGVGGWAMKRPWPSCSVMERWWPDAIGKHVAGGG